MYNDPKVFPPVLSSQEKDLTSSAVKTTGESSYAAHISPGMKKLFFPLDVAQVLISAKRTQCNRFNRVLIMSLSILRSMSPSCVAFALPQVSS